MDLRSCMWYWQDSKCRWSLPASSRGSGPHHDDLSPSGPPPPPLRVSWHSAARAATVGPSKCAPSHWQSPSPGTVPTVPVPAVTASGRGPQAQRASPESSTHGLIVKFLSLLFKFERGRPRGRPQLTKAKEAASFRLCSMSSTARPIANTAFFKMIDRGRWQHLES
jgi:hypothetical protein